MRREAHGELRYGGGPNKKLKTTSMFNRRNHGILNNKPLILDIDIVLHFE
jgi:hypothetical protein